jgi:hypothetical protein
MLDLSQTQESISTPAPHRIMQNTETRLIEEIEDASPHIQQPHRIIWLLSSMFAKKAQNDQK